MDLIIGNRHVSPASIRRVAGGVEAVLKGEALISLLDAAFHGAGTIHVLGGDLDRRPMDLTGIDMTGGETRVTLTCAGPAPMLV
ncbi:hypothetical protein [Pseudogemmobacter humi]|uniref:Uncharacterized protein n=1 Tax=Pseudogemmobacter humi TaxID=2483812 RepID=A0A3P5XEW7_9RHOB|nr:hypothetical protein [Pseudogemmobacter humi]VDC33352.1 hypothetical protein XINFAN_03782 [Pseudogemmobacter humi]